MTVGLPAAADAIHELQLRAVVRVTDGDLLRHESQADGGGVLVNGRGNGASVDVEAKIGVVRIQRGGQLLGERQPVAVLATAQHGGAIGICRGSGRQVIHGGRRLPGKVEQLVDAVASGLVQQDVGVAPDHLAERTAVGAVGNRVLHRQGRHEGQAILELTDHGRQLGQEGQPLPQRLVRVRGARVGQPGIFVVVLAVLPVAAAGQAQLVADIAAVLLSGGLLVVVADRVHLIGGGGAGGARRIEALEQQQILVEGRVAGDIARLVRGHGHGRIEGHRLRDARLLRLLEQMRQIGHHQLHGLIRHGACACRAALALGDAQARVGRVGEAHRQQQHQRQDAQAQQQRGAALATCVWLNLCVSHISFPLYLTLVMFDDSTDAA